MHYDPARLAVCCPCVSRIIPSLFHFFPTTRACFPHASTAAASGVVVAVNWSWARWVYRVPTERLAKPSRDSAWSIRGVSRVWLNATFACVCARACTVSPRYLDSRDRTRGKGEKEEKKKKEKNAGNDERPSESENAAAHGRLAKRSVNHPAPPPAATGFGLSA